MYRFAFVVLACLAFAAASIQPARAAGIIGQVYAGGHVYRSDGYYYDASGNPYRWVAGYYYYSGCYRQYQQGYYQRVHLPAKPDDPLLLLSRAVADRARVDGEIKKRTTEYALAGEYAKLLGLDRDFRFDAYPYGIQASYGQYAAAHAYSPAALVGQVQYSKIAEFYGAGNALELEAQVAGRQSDNAARAAAAFSGNVGTDVATRGKVAEILATGQATASANSSTITALRAGAKVTETRSEPILLGPKVQAPVPQAADGGAIPDEIKAFAHVAANRCASCHGGGKTAGGFDVGTFPSLSEDRRAEIVAKELMSGKMPKGGPALSIEEIKAFMFK